MITRNNLIPSLFALFGLATLPLGLYVLSVDLRAGVGCILASIFFQYVGLDEMKGGK